MELLTYTYINPPQKNNKYRNFKFKSYTNQIICDSKIGFVKNSNSKSRVNKPAVSLSKNRRTNYFLNSPLHNQKIIFQKKKNNLKLKVRCYGQQNYFKE